MSDRRERDPLAELAQANPIDPVQLPTASLARVDASMRREIESDKERSLARESHRPRRLLGVGLSGALVAAVTVAVLARVPGGSLGTPEPSGPLGNAACVEQYSAATLATREWAFDGNVTAVSGDEVTFVVNATFRGPYRSVATLLAPGMTGTTVTSGGGPTLVVGERYLVAGEDGFVWGCGFTQPYAEAAAAEWAATFQD